MAYDPEELAEGILELFADRHDCDQIVAAFAPSSRETKAPIEGFSYYRNATEELAFYDKREVEEQAELDRLAALYHLWLNRSARNSRYYARRRDNELTRNRAWLANMTDEQRDARRKRAAESMRAIRLRAKVENAQSLRLQAWVAKGNTRRRLEAQRVAALAGDPAAIRAEKKRKQKAAQAQRRRDRMSEAVKRQESARAQERKQRKAA